MGSPPIDLMERFTYRPDATLEPIGHEAGEECTAIHFGIGSSVWVQFADASSHPVLRHELEPLGVGLLCPARLSEENANDG